MRDIIEIAFYIPILPTLLLWLSVNRAHPVKHTFGYLLIAGLLISTAGAIWVKFGTKNNLPFFHLHLLVEFVCLTSIYSKLMNQSMLNFKWLAILVGFILIWLGNGLLGPGFTAYPDYSRGAEALFVMFYTISWFEQMLREKRIKNPAKNFEFWLSTGLFVFFSANFILFVFSNFVMHTDSKVFNVIWTLHAILVILLYLMYAIAILWIPKTTK